MGCRVVRVERDGPVQLIERSFEIALLPQHGSQNRVSLGVAGAEPDRGAEFGRRLVKFSLLPKDDSLRVMRLRQGWVPLAGLAKRKDGLIKIFLLLQGHAKIVVGFSVTGVKGNQSAILAYSILPLCLFEQGKAEIVPRARILRI